MSEDKKVVRCKGSGKVVPLQGLQISFKKVVCPGCNKLRDVELLLHPERSGRIRIHMVPYYVPLGEVAHGRLKMQSQYAVRYLMPHENPFLGEGIRFRGELTDYHGVSIHPADVDTFVERVQTWRRENGCIP